MSIPQRIILWIGAVAACIAIRCSYPGDYGMQYRERNVACVLILTVAGIMSAAKLPTTR